MISAPGYESSRFTVRRKDVDWALECAQWPSPGMTAKVGRSRPWSSTVFEALSDKLSGVFDRLRRRGSLSEADVTEAPGSA